MTHFSRTAACRQTSCGDDDALLVRASPRAPDVALAPGRLGSRGPRRSSPPPPPARSCVPRAARRPPRPPSARSLSPAHRRWYALVRAGASSPSPCRTRHARGYAARPFARRRRREPRLGPQAQGRDGGARIRRWRPAARAAPAGMRAAARRPRARVLPHPVSRRGRWRWCVLRRRDGPPSEQPRWRTASAAKRVPCERFVQPETADGARRPVGGRTCIAKRLRPVGIALSPNGSAFNEDSMISLALLDDVIEIDAGRHDRHHAGRPRVAEATEKSSRPRS